jgi:ubiquinone/menaquinone biosynthesis C-methylase UbiE
MLLIVSKRHDNSRKSSRPPRIRVPNNEPAVFTVDTRKVLGVIKRISATGGSVVISAKGPAPHGTVAEMCLNTVYGKVTAQIEFLHTGADGIRHAQAFRFLAMDAVSRKRFTAAAQKMQHAGFSDAEERQTALGWASNGLSKVTQSVGRLIGMSNKKC